MRYQKRLFFFFTFVSILVVMVAGAIGGLYSEFSIFKDNQQKYASIAATIAADLSGDIIEQIKSNPEETSPTYQSVRQKLLKAKLANQRKDTFVSHLYILYPDPKNSKQFLYATDTEGKKPGTLDTKASDTKLHDHLLKPFAGKEFARDDRGVFLTGYAPIFDAAGNYVATVAVDNERGLVYQNYYGLVFYATISFIISIILSLIVSIIFAKKVTKALDILTIATIEIGKGDLSYRIPNMPSKDEFNDLANAINQMSEGLEEKERLKKGFSHYVSQYIIDKIIAAKGAVKLEGERRKVTVLFSDIRNFTSLSETMSPEQLILFINEYFGTMIDIVLKNNGLLDKLLGDGMMVEFGAPLPDSFQERNAVLVAIKMQNALKKLDDKWETEGKPRLTIGIGIHTGEAIVGTIGSEKRMQYTAIGDTVNLAAALEHLSKEVHRPIIISKSTYLALKGEFPCTDLGEKTVTRREQKVHAYAVNLEELQ